MLTYTTKLMCVKNFWQATIFGFGQKFAAQIAYEKYTFVKVKNLIF